MKPPHSCTIFIFAIIGLLNVTCKKSDSEPPPITYRTLKVLEKKTMSPIVGAEVSIYVCKRWAYGGCPDGGIIGPITSDHDGQFQFNSTMDVYYIGASHKRYWDGGTGGTDFIGNRQPITDILLTPVAYTKIHLRKIKSHSADVALVTNLYADPYNVLSTAVTNVFNQPDDSTVFTPSYGYTRNIIKWHFLNQSGNVDTGEGSGEIPVYYINRFDTASVEINY